MKKLILLMTALSMFTGCFTVKNTASFSYEKLPVQQYYQALQDSSDYYLIDVRTPGEYAKSHAPGAVNFNFLAFHFGRDVDSLDRSKPVFIYCQTCHRSPFAGKILKRKGFRKVYDLKQGFSQWQKAGLPLKTTDTKDF